MSKTARKHAAKTACSRPVKASLTKELGPNAEFLAAITLSELPSRQIKDLCRLHGVPIAKYKDDMADRLAAHLTGPAGRRVRVTIGA